MHEILHYRQNNFLIVAAFPSLYVYMYNYRYKENIL